MSLRILKWLSLMAGISVDAYFTWSDCSSLFLSHSVDKISFTSKLLSFVNSIQPERDLGLTLVCRVAECQRVIEQYQNTDWVWYLVHFNGHALMLYFSTLRKCHLRLNGVARRTSSVHLHRKLFLTQAPLAFLYVSTDIELAAEILACIRLRSTFVFWTLKG